MGSKETLSKYLKQLERTGLIIHDENGYRVNPLYDYPRLNQLAKSLRRPEKAWEYSYITPPGPGAAITKNNFLDQVQREFNVAFSIYRWMLTRLVQVNDRIAAQELVDIFLRSQINPVLTELAKNTWLARKTAPVEALKKKRLALVGR